jgi:hypothetical protein
MKIWLASVLEPENFGTHRVISIAYSEPRLTKTIGVFEPLIPLQEYQDKYKKEKDINFEKAKSEFIENYSNQLNNFFQNLQMKSLAENEKNIIDLLPFEDGDTLVSWERQENYNYRSIAATFLEKCGYEVELY